MTREIKKKFYENSIAIIGGSGVYELEDLTNIEEIFVKTPFGKPSDAIIKGQLFGKTVLFLARHDRQHSIAPYKLNHKANIYALKSLGAKFLISICAVGSLRGELKPRDIAIPDQIIDQSTRKKDFTFFSKGIIAHTSMAEPYSKNLRQVCLQAINEFSTNVHAKACYINIDGPSFSSRAESNFYRQVGGDIIGMTNAGEAKLAKEAEIASATIGLITDYDCWREDAEPVSAENAISNLKANAETAKEIIKNVVKILDVSQTWSEHKALDSSLITTKNLWSDKKIKKLNAILSRFL